MLKKTLNAADLALQIEMHYMRHPDVMGGSLRPGLPIVIQRLPVPRPDGVNWHAVFGEPAAYGEAMAAAIAAVQAEYNLEHPFPGSSAARL